MLAARDTCYPQFQALANRLRPHYLWHGFTKGDRTWRHFHAMSPFHRLYLFLKGSAWVRHARDHKRVPVPQNGHPGKGWATLEPGHIYFLPSSASWQLYSDGAFEKFFLHFRMELWPGRDLFAYPLGPLPVVTPYPHLNQLAKWASGGPGEILRFHGAVANYLSRLLPPSPTGPNRVHRDILMAEKYRSIFEAAEETPFRQWSFVEIARRFGRSLPSLSRSFRRDTGMTLTDFFRHRLARRAGDLLVYDDLNVREIAFSLGFEDEHYFSRFFKKAMGIPPLAWRKRHRGEVNYFFPGKEESG